METYPLDVDASEVVRWLIDEQRAGTLNVDLRITRSYEQEQIERPTVAGLGDDEQEEIHEIIVKGELEVSPPSGQEGWLLRVIVENVIGSNMPDDRTISEAVEEIDLDTFYLDFLDAEQGSDFVSLEAETKKDKTRFDRFFRKMVTNHRH